MRRRRVGRQRILAMLPRVSRITKGAHMDDGDNKVPFGKLNNTAFYRWIAIIVVILIAVISAAVVVPMLLSASANSDAAAENPMAKYESDPHREWIDAALNDYEVKVILKDMWTGEYDKAINYDDIVSLGFIYYLPDDGTKMYLQANVTKLKDEYIVTVLENRPY